MDAELAKSAVAAKSLLITGAGGSIGAGLAEAALAGQPKKLILLDVSEGALYEVHRRLVTHLKSSSVKIIPLVGNIANQNFMLRLMQEQGVEFVIHTAAYKHVPLMELNPFSAVANNSIATYSLVKAAAMAGVQSLTLLSTDKAVNPRSIMGASKRIAELVVLSHATKTLKMNAVRLGNVLGSSGSVSLVFEEQAENGGPLTVTHPETTRYFLTQTEAETSILAAASSPAYGQVYVADCGEAVRILDLAQFAARGARIEIVGLRPGDKLHEELVGEGEQVGFQEFRRMRVLQSPHPDADDMVSSMLQLQTAIEQGDLQDMVRVTKELVPSYVASKLVLTAGLMETH